LGARGSSQVFHPKFTYNNHPGTWQSSVKSDILNTGRESLVEERFAMRTSLLDQTFHDIKFHFMYCTTLHFMYHYSDHCDIHGGCSDINCKHVQVLLLLTEAGFNVSKGKIPLAVREILLLGGRESSIASGSSNTSCFN